ncbi:hypothetical protein M422DRAFT_213064 [Sphaerobolus stellatus SS14]|uniref:HSF-type DNA-binding domain-containing protein n=1 Tax=Sphaerobolus stellatus (strain SS14) TaxID=990650 RepID=A0A0C9TWA5_SPHS4|nr:hypothetical protein M422DRAFT_213064 [Sphaerobolus stellatus SS14]
MALTTRKAAVFTNPSKATRQQIPPFLSKLYHMVNDPATDNLIRWSDAGDSFYVYDHERFAKDVLPSWFKHSNFGSFVRQLNNYGFHKVPHLQQGVLRSDGEAEISHFENQYFQRGQPDLLCLIQRKKQLQNDPREDSPTDFKEPVVSGTSQANGAESDSTLSQHNIKGTVIDINGIVNGIQAIKRHQHAISAELKELHVSNQSLWQEIYAARERHKKHHDTITRILKFLAGVFGHTGNGAPRAQEVPHSSPDKTSASAMVPRRGNFLMIENNDKEKRSNSEKMDINEMMMEPLDFEGGRANDGERFATIEVPASPASQATTSTPKPPDTQSVVSDLPSPQLLLSPPTPAATPASVPSPAPSMNGYPFPANNHNRMTPTEPEPVYPNNYASPVTSHPNANALTASSSAQSDADMQNTFAALFNNPAQLQRVLAALQSGVPMSMPDNIGPTMPSGVPDNQPQQSSNAFNGFRSPVDGQLSPGSMSLFNPLNGLGTLSISPPSDDTAMMNGLAQSNSQLQKSYKDAAEVEADVNTLQNHIDSLIESLGVDAHTGASLRGDQLNHAPDDDIVTSNGTSTNGIPAPQFDMQNDSFDFDSFLSLDPVYAPVQPGFNAMANGADQIGAFLDEVRSVSNGSDVTVDSNNIAGGVVDGHEGDGKGGSRKRKSGAVELVPDGKSPKAPRTSKKR